MAARHEDESGKAAESPLDLLSAVPIAGTAFLELHGAHPPGSLADTKLRFTRRVMFLAGRWRNKLNEAMRETGQSHARWLALTWIHLLGGRVNHRELAERIGVELPTLIRLLNRLEEEGLVERAAMPDSARAKTARLTAEGKRVLEELHMITERSCAAFLAGVDEAQLAASMALFDDLLARAESD